MKLPKGIKYFNVKVKSRVKGLRLELKIIFVISVFSILSIEFLLNKYPAKYQWQYDFGVIWLKLSYSYLSAFIFYYIVVYLPKERKRVRTFVLINDNILGVCDTITIILETLHKQTDKSLTKYPTEYTQSMIYDICKKVHPNNTVIVDILDKRQFENTYTFMTYYIDRIKELIRVLIVFYDILDDNIVSNIAYIHSNIDRMSLIDLTKFGNKSIGIYGYFLDILNNESNILRKNLDNYRTRYVSRHTKLYSLGLKGE